MQNFQLQPRTKSSPQNQTKQLAIDKIRTKTTQSPPRIQQTTIKTQPRQTSTESTQTRLRFEQRKRRTDW